MPPENQKPTFSLQANDSGAWRNVVKGNKDQMEAIEYHAANVAMIAGDRYKWRIIELGLDRVIGYCRAPDFIWTPPQ